MPKAIDKTGRKVGRLTAIERVAGENGKPSWRCVCDCGMTVVVYATNFRETGTRSCGCLQRDIMVDMKLSHGDAGTHTRRCTPEYKAWSHAKGRCYNSNDSRYDDYGGRGIRMCDKWRDSYEAFLEDMGRRPVGRYSLDRINVHGNYEPNNCRWATDIQQAQNKRKYKTLFMLN